jgi:hypothetical protein
VSFENMVPHSIAGIVEMYFWPSSTKLDKYDEAFYWVETDLHEHLYRLFACRANALCRKEISTVEKDYNVGQPLRLGSACTEYTDLQNSLTPLSHEIT